jgi:hypothetical protein
MRPPRQRALTLVLIAAMLGAAALAYWLLLARGPAGVASAPPPAAVAPAAEPAARLEVSRADGGATLLRGGAAREPLRAGAALRPDDVIETAEGASVVLAAGESYQVVLDGAARFAVKEIAAEVSRFRVDDGLVTATVRDDPRRAFVVEAGGAVARTRGGALGVANVGGRVTVGVTAGETDLESGGRIVTLRQGQASSAEPGQAPSAPVALPRSLLLKVDWPEARETNRRKLVVQGQATPGAVLTIGGQRVRVGPDGRFSQTIWLREGAQALDAVARDVAGRRERSRGPTVVLDTRAPDPQFDTNALWKGAEERSRDSR